MIEAAVALLLLHAPDGAEIRVNPDQVTSLRSAPPAPTEKLFPESVRCMVNLADGKYVAVIEPCPDVQQMLEKAR